VNISVSPVTLVPLARDADNGIVRITKNPYQRAATACLVVGLVLTVAVSSVPALPFLAVACVLMYLAWSRRRDYPR
jgi:hypothetical protein